MLFQIFIIIQHSPTLLHYSQLQIPDTPKRQSSPEFIIQPRSAASSNPHNLLITSRINSSLSPSSAYKYSIPLLKMQIPTDSCSRNWGTRRWCTGFLRACSALNEGQWECTAGAAAWHHARYRWRIARPGLGYLAARARLVNRCVAREGARRLCI